MKDRRRTRHRKSRSKSNTSKKVISTIKNTISVYNSPKRISPPAKNLTQGLIPVQTYPHTTNDMHDGIIFLIGHSAFKGYIGKLCHFPTKPGMKQTTMLVAPVGTSCHWITEPKLFEAIIRARFSDALSYTHDNIDDFTFLVKTLVKNEETFSKRIEKEPKLKKFFESRSEFSSNPEEYCERRWIFYNREYDNNYDKDILTVEEMRKNSMGKVMLLRRDKKGVPFFEILYENEINDGDFILRKTELFNKLYSPPYNLRNVLLVDFGCSVLEGVNEEDQQKLYSGRFGGKK